ncbi:MAG: general secretion pathway protein GspE [Desulfuromonadales bacterium]|nr:general secretion pathway protein GspE [Desulfuromonadales bacterium]
MALKLGELLLKEKLITAAQLEEALKNHVIYGIRLGSCLVEMGYIDEDVLAQLLSRKLGVPCVGKKEMSSISKELLDDFPRNLVQAHQVVPIKLEGNRLSVAMADPTDFKAIEEIGFVTGNIVTPFIAPDVLISQALAKYYQINSGRTRYQVVAEQLRKPVAAETAKPATISMPSFTDTSELLNVTIPAEFEGFGQLRDASQDDLYQMPDDISRYTVDRLSMNFADARTRDDIANVFINYLGQEFSSGALFIVRGNSAVGWRGVSAGERVTGFAELTMLLSKPSVLRDVVDTKNFSMGALINTPENRQILKTLNIPPEVSLLVLPVVMLNKVVAIVLVTADMEALGRRLSELQKLVRKASLAFEMLIIKNKILMT